MRIQTNEMRIENDNSQINLNLINTCFLIILFLYSRGVNEIKTNGILVVRMDYFRSIQGATNIGKKHAKYLERRVSIYCISSNLNLVDDC